MESITLKEIAGYLPYELQIKGNDKVVGKMVCEISFESPIVTIGAVLRNNFYKPILYPLSMLTQEIEHNGGKFIPLVKYVESLAEPCEDFDPDNLTDFESAVLSMLTNYEMRHQIDLEFLQEHHFDYQDLIGRGIAIDKSKI